MFNPIRLCILFIALTFTNLAELSSTSCKLPERGLPGPTGPTGPAGPISFGPFASFSILGTQTITPGNAAIFDDPPDAIGGNISYDGLTGVITLNETGYYRVTYGLSANASNRQFALTLNGSIILGSPIDTQTSQMQGLSVVFKSTTAPALLRLINNSGTSTNVTTSTASSTSAYLVIQQIQ